MQTSTTRIQTPLLQTSNTCKAALLSGSRRDRTTQRTLPHIKGSLSDDLGDSTYRDENYGAFQVGKLLSNHTPLYSLAMVCTPWLQKHMLLRATLLPIKQTLLQEHIGTDHCQFAVQHSSFLQVMRRDGDTLEDKGKSGCTWAVVWLTTGFPGEEGADCCTVRICCPNATFSGTPTVFWGELGGCEATDTTVSCLAKQRSSLNLCKA